MGEFSYSNYEQKRSYKDLFAADKNMIYETWNMINDNEKDSQNKKNRL